MQSAKNMPSSNTACSKCGTTLNEEWSFCPQCKSPVEGTDCMYCGERIKAAWKFCPYCTNKNDIHVNKSVDEKSNDWLKNILCK